LVPTSAQTRADGQATPKTSSTGSGVGAPDALGAFELVDVDELADVGDVEDVVEDGVDPEEPALGSDAVHVWPPSALYSTSPCAGTTSLVVVPVVPAARHADVVRHTALRRMPTPGDTVASAHICPPSELSATAPWPCPGVVGT
jgi:hypothetical protein